MANFDHNKILRGAFGKVWIDDERFANVKSFEAKLTLNYEDVDVNGELGTKKRYMGFSGAGTIVLHKFNSAIALKLKDAIKRGEMPQIKIVAAIDDPSSSGVERVSLTDVTFDELTLSKFENKGLLEEEVPFAFGDYEFLDLI